MTKNLIVISHPDWGRMLVISTRVCANRDINFRFIFEDGCESEHIIPHMVEMMEPPWIFEGTIVETMKLAADTHMLSTHEHVSDSEAGWSSDWDWWATIYESRGMYAAAKNMRARG